MASNKKIQNKITEMLKPDYSFEEFCSRNDIEYTEKQPVRSRMKIFKRLIMSISAAAAVVALCIGLPIAFSNSSDTTNMKRYSDIDVLTAPMRYDELVEKVGYVGFDLNKSASYTNIFRVMPKSNREITIGYTTSSVIYGVYADDKAYEFEFDYLIRAYSGYDFNDIELYTAANKTMVSGGLNYNYIINEGPLYSIAYISFEKNDYDYYINLRGFHEKTEIDDNSVKVFIENVLGK